MTNNHMLKHMQNWDYRQRCIYMVTVTVASPQPILGRLTGDINNPAIQLSDVGVMVTQCWQDIPANFPGVTLLKWQVMPDHFHGVIFVEAPQAKPLGTMVGSFKAHSTSLYRAGIRAVCGAAQNDSGTPDAPPPSAPSPGVPPAACGRLESRQEARLWSPGFQDTILRHRGQLAYMRAYIKDNPRRLAVKRAHPELFRIIRDLPACGHTFGAIGNHFLLDAPAKRQVQISRSMPPDALAAAEADLLAAARHGAVLVSPCISPGEKQIARAALQSELPLIVTLENGFPELYKPPKSYFDACAAGRLLMLAPWPHHSDRHPITREQCLALNRFAEQITQANSTP